MKTADLNSQSEGTGTVLFLYDPANLLRQVPASNHDQDVILPTKLLSKSIVLECFAYPVLLQQTQPER